MRVRGPWSGGCVRRRRGEELTLCIWLWRCNQLSSIHVLKLKKQQDKKAKWPELVQELGSTSKHSEEDHQRAQEDPKRSPIEKNVHV